MFKRMLISLALLCLITVSMCPVAQAQNSSYYDSFIFQVVGTCDNINALYFNEAYSWIDADLGTDEASRPLRSGLSLQLFTDGTYFAQYSEYAISKVEGSVTEFDTVYTQDLSGTWKVSGNQLQVLGLGTGTPLQLDEGQGMKNVIQFQITQTLHNSLILTRPMMLGRVQTNVGARGISINQFCGVNR